MPRSNPYRISVIASALAALAAIAGLALPRDAAAQVQSGPATITGVFAVLGAHPRDLYFLYDERGTRDYIRLEVSQSQVAALGGAQRLRGQRVTVSGTMTTGTRALASLEPVLSVSQLRLAGVATQSTEVVSGTVRYINLLCKFSDVSTEPHAPAWYTNLLGMTSPGVGHYYRESSYQLVDMTGSTTVTGWLTLPQPKSYYTTSGNFPNTTRLLTDCLAAADAQVDYTQYWGVNLFLNADFNVGGVGSIGRWPRTLDGVSGQWGFTWIPDNGAQAGVLYHEIGHNFGFPHASNAVAMTGASPNEYGNVWDVMGNGQGWTDPTYGWVSSHTSMYHKDTAGWLAANRRFTYTGGTQAVTLEQSAQAGANNYLAAFIPIGGSSTHMLVVEARRKTGYDAGLPGNAVIIHEVDTGRTVPAYVVDADNDNITSDAETQWVAGETYTSDYGITITVNTATATGFTITIATQTGCPAPAMTAPEQGATVAAPSASIGWASLAGCTFDGYQVRIKDVPVMSSAGTTILTANVSSVSTNQTVPSAWYDKTLYVGVRAAGATGNAAWSVRRFRVHNYPNSITATDAWTSDGGSDWSVRKTTFSSGDTIRYVGAVSNQTSGAQSVRMTWDATGPGGSIFSSVNDPWSMPQGQTYWYYSSTVPARLDVNTPVQPQRPGALTGQMLIPMDAAPGTYTFTFSLTYNFQTTTMTANFTVGTGPAAPGAPALTSPANAAVSTEGAAVTLTWSGDAEQYQAELAAPAGTSTSAWGAATTWTPATSVVNGGAYSWRVRGRNGAVEGPWSSTRTFTVTPNLPSNLRVANVTTGSIQIAWTDTSAAETEFQVVWNQQGSGAYTTVSVAANATNWTHTGLSAGQTYYYWVKSCAGTVCSALSPSITGATAVPAKPQALRAGSVTDTSIQLLWTAGSNNATAYQVVWSPYGSASYTTVDLPATPASWEHTGLQAGRSYYYWVRACNAVGCSALAGALGLTTTGANTPAAPANVRIGLTTNGSIEVLWNDVSAETSYELVWTNVDPVSYVWDRLPANQTSATQSGLPTGTTRYYWVRACLDLLCSGYAGGVAGAAYAPPATPANLRVTATASGSVSLAWDDVADEQMFQVVWNRAGTGSYTPVNQPADTTAWTHTGLTNGQTYYYWVRACIGVVCSGWSAAVAGTPGSGSSPLRAAAAAEVPSPPSTPPTAGGPPPPPPAGSGPPPPANLPRPGERR